jgi:hypothetical protein
MDPKKSSGKLIDDGIMDPMKQVPRTNFQKQILKSVIGESKANQVLTSMSMQIIPKINEGTMGNGFKDGK